MEGNLLTNKLTQPARERKLARFSGEACQLERMRGFCEWPIGEDACDRVLEWR